MPFIFDVFEDIAAKGVPDNIDMHAAWKRPAKTPLELAISESICVDERGSLNWRIIFMRLSMCRLKRDLRNALNAELCLR